MYEWISVDDRLPEDYRTDALIFTDRWVKVGWYDCECWFVYPPSKSRYNVTHWMPLPEPSKLSSSFECEVKNSGF